MDKSTTSSRVSKCTTDALFFNACNQGINLDAFEEVKQFEVPQKQELREEEPPIDIFQSINEKNKLLDTIRAEQALISNEHEVLVKGPHKLAAEEESVTLEELPALVKQAAEAALLYQINKQQMSLKRNTKHAAKRIR